jgi:uncharacterized membrane protein
MMDKIKKLYDGSKEAAKNTKEKITDKINTYSGKDVLQKVDEFTQVYGDILLGMDKELTEIKKEVKTLKENKTANKENDNYRLFFALSILINIALLTALLVKSYA